MEFTGGEKYFNALHNFNRSISKVHKLVVDLVEPLNELSPPYRAPDCLSGLLCTRSRTGNASPAVFNQPSLILRKFIQNCPRNDKDHVLACYQLLQSAD